MRAIGGEIELKASDYTICFTDSGRSSLRLFLRSNNNKSKKYLLPSFFCEVIEKIFIEENILYSFYTINQDLSCNENEILKNNFDVLYIINYFGQKNSLNSSTFNDKIIIEDNVFFLDFENKSKFKNWFAFNSFRKISKLGAGSLIKTNTNLDLSLIKHENAHFSNLKKEAKDIKYKYLHKNLFSQEKYLSKFKEAETTLDKQKEIFTMDSNSIYQLISLNSNIEQKIRKKRYKILYNLFSDKCVNKDTLYYSFFVIFIHNRDSFKEELMKNNIYLPVHWPSSSLPNILYNNLISIPLFEVYTDNEFLYLIEKLKSLDAQKEYK